MELCTGRPADCAGRIPQEVRCYDFLDALGVEYQRVDHEPADTMAVCEERAAALKTRICKNLFLCNRQETVFYMLVMPADKPFKTSAVSPQLGVARLHFADETYMTQFLDLHPGSVRRSHQSILVARQDIHHVHKDFRTAASFLKHRLELRRGRTQISLGEAGHLLIQHFHLLTDFTETRSV